MFEKPASQTPDQSKKKSVKRNTRLGVAFAAGMSILAEARSGQAQSIEGPVAHGGGGLPVMITGDVAVTESVERRLTIEELTSQRDHGLRMLRDRASLTVPHLSGVTVYEAARETSTVTGATSQPEVAHADSIPVAKSLQALEGHRINISSISGEVVHASRYADPMLGYRLQTVQGLQFRVLDLSQDQAAAHTGKHVQETIEAATEDDALALALERLSHGTPGAGHVLKNLQAEEGLRSDALRVELLRQNRTLANIRIHTEQLSSGRVQVRIEGDEVALTSPATP